MWVSERGEGAVGYLCASSTGCCSAPSLRLTDHSTNAITNRSAHTQETRRTQQFHSTLKYSCMKLALNPDIYIYIYIKAQFKPM